MKRLLIAFILLAASLPAHAFETDAKNAIIMDAQTGTILFEKDADAPIYPASMTKMMTAYMLFDALKSGVLSLKDTYPVSEKAWRKGGSKMFVQLGKNIAIEDLMRGIVIQSGNDACIVFSEGFAGSEERFAERMTKTAHDMDMSNTIFKNATGWPDEEHVTTARDLLTLAHRTIEDFPEYYPVYSEREFTYHDIKQQNRNLLLARDLGVDGMKTGYTEAAGYGITISGEKDGRRVHVVVGGLTSEQTRADAAEKLYRYAFTEFRNKHYHGTILGTVPLWYGIKDDIAVTAAPDTTLTTPIVDTDNASFTFVTNNTLAAPITKGEVVGTLILQADNMSAQHVPLVAAESVGEAGFVKRFITNFKELTGAK